MVDINRLAILANQFGGIEFLASELGIDAEIVEASLKGEYLDRNDRSDLDIALAQYDKTLDDFQDAEIQDYTSDLETNLDFINDAELINDYRYLTAENQVELEDLQGFGLYANLTTRQTRELIEYLKEDINHKASDYLDKYNDDSNNGNIDFWDLKESAFWAWYRETFYE